MCGMHEPSISPRLQPAMNGTMLGAWPDAKMRGVVSCNTQWSIVESQR
jgi:hypothetical protein